VPGGVAGRLARPRVAPLACGPARLHGGSACACGQPAPLRRGGSGMAWSWSRDVRLWPERARSREHEEGTMVGLVEDITVCTVHHAK
jgi:hypothetical protein